MATLLPQCAILTLVHPPCHVYQMLNHLTLSLSEAAVNRVPIKHGAGCGSAGADVWWDGGFHRVADPLRHPLGGVASLTNPIGSVKDKVNVGLFRLLTLFQPLSSIYTASETTTLDCLRVRLTPTPCSESNAYARRRLSCNLSAGLRRHQIASSSRSRNKPKLFLWRGWATFAELVGQPHDQRLMAYICFFIYQQACGPCQP